MGTGTRKGQAVWGGGGERETELQTKHGSTVPNLAHAWVKDVPLELADALQVKVRHNRRH